MPEHIDAIASEIARITKKYILTLEDEGSLSSRTWPRNYRRLFERFGFRQIKREYIIDIRKITGIGGIGCVFRIFEKRIK